MSRRKSAKGLLPCPFCGSKAEFGRVPDTFERLSDGDTEPHPDCGGEFIQCSDVACFASTCLVFPTMTDAKPFLIEKWNRRAAAAKRLRRSDLLRDLIAELLDTELAELACTGSMAPVEDVLGRMKDALAAQPTAQEPPVAWQWRLKGQGKWGPWKAIKCEDYAAQYFRTAQLQRGPVDAEAYEVRPLYAAMQTRGQTDFAQRSSSDCTTVPGLSGDSSVAERKDGGVS